MRVLMVTNMYPSRQRPEFGVFVRDQLEALGRRDDVEVDLYVIEGGGMKAYRKAVKPLKKHLKQRGYDIVHAHYGLTGHVARSAGAKPLVVTFHGTDLTNKKVARISRRVAAKADRAIIVSESLQEALPKRMKNPVAILPTGVDLERFGRIDRVQARRDLGLDPEGTYLLFPADPARPEKRFDRAQEVASQIEDAALLTLGAVDPGRVPLLINAADAVVVPSEYEGFGLATMEALACDVPVVATPTGIAPQVLPRVSGSHCIDYDPTAWRAAVESVLADPDPRVQGRDVAAEFSCDAMAARLTDLYSNLLGEGGR